MPRIARYILRRMGLAVITLMGVVVAVFIMTQILPSNPAALRAGPYQSAEIIARLEQEMGLDKPVYVQFANYARLLAQGDLGTSWRTNQPITEELGKRLPATLELALTALIFATVIGVSLGVLAAVYVDTWIDHVVRVFATLGASSALFFLALVGIHIFYYTLRWAPPPLDRLTVGLSPPPAVTGLFTVDSLLAGQFTTFLTALRHLWLPALTLAFVVSAPIIKMMRAGMINTLRSDFVRTTRAVGLPSRQIILVDALRNALIPVLTTLGIVFGYLMAGNVIIERVFSWAGIGQYAWNALITNDFNAIRGFVLLIACFYVVLNLVIDIAYGVIDPRIRLD